MKKVERVAANSVATRALNKLNLVEDLPGKSQLPKRRWRNEYARSARKKSTRRKSGQYASQK